MSLTATNILIIRHNKDCAIDICIVFILSILRCLVAMCQAVLDPSTPSTGDCAIPQPAPLVPLTPAHADTHPLLYVGQ